VNYIGRIVEGGRGGNPRNVIFLTCDADGVMPPVAKLTRSQALYHFLSGYTADVAGVEASMAKGETRPRFSPCFGAPFLARPPMKYAEMLGDRLARHKTNCWLVNTGWVGGPYHASDRVKIQFTRAIIRAILTGGLAKVEMVKDPYFGLAIPTQCPGVPPKVLVPSKAWKSKKAYDESAQKVAERFHANFEKRFPDVPNAITAGGPPK
jgi:phosphoenolpyruvate carboxykinase (ATP)